MQCCQNQEAFAETSPKSGSRFEHSLCRCIAKWWIAVHTFIHLLVC